MTSLQKRVTSTAIRASYNSLPHSDQIFVAQSLHCKSESRAHGHKRPCILQFPISLRTDFVLCSSSSICSNLNEIIIKKKRRKEKHSFHIFASQPLHQTYSNRLPYICLTKNTQIQCLPPHPPPSPLPPSTHKKKKEEKELRSDICPSKKRKKGKSTQISSLNKQKGKRKIKHSDQILSSHRLPQRRKHQKKNTQIWYLYHTPSLKQHSYSMFVLHLFPYDGDRGGTQKKKTFSEYCRSWPQILSTGVTFDGGFEFRTFEVRTLL